MIIKIMVLIVLITKNLKKKQQDMNSTSYNFSLSFYPI